MELPVYSGVIWQARIAGTATVHIDLNSAGAVANIDVQSPHAALTNWLKLWFKKSSFLSECGGQTIQFTLRYRLDGAPHDKPENQIVLKFPDTIEITAYPPILRGIVN
jgi:hypothetical protein